MVYNTISVKSIIAKLYTDLDLQEENHRETDFIEWAGEAISKIRAFTMFNVKVTGKEGIDYVQISNYQAKLPKDLYGLIGVAYSPTTTGNFIPMRYGSGTHSSRVTNTETAVSTSPVVSESSLINYTMYAYGADYATAVELLNTDMELRARMEALAAPDRNSQNTGTKRTETRDPYYTINNSYIKTNYKDGYLMIAYTAIPTDTEGYPLIPDDEGFKEAIYWYIVKKYWYPKWVLGEIRDRVYYDAQNSWNFYCRQAYGNAMMPNIDQLESLKNKWLELVPEINDFNNFFNTSGESQKIYIQ
jgi:hypothetical protein